jgi:excisionase family DNA binding protein
MEVKTTLAPILKAQSDLLDRDDAATYLGISPRTLAVWATTKRYGLKYVRIGRRVKYRRADLDEFIASRTVNADSHTEARK